MLSKLIEISIAQILPMMQIVKLFWKEIWKYIIKEKYMQSCALK